MINLYFYRTSAKKASVINAEAFLVFLYLGMGPRFFDASYYLTIKITDDTIRLLSSTLKT